MRGASLLATAVAAARGVAGCAAPPAADGSARPSLPALAFDAGAGARVAPGVAVERWWLQFDDAGLHRRIDDALAHNADLSIAAARLRAARAQLDQAAGAALPSLDASASTGRSRVSEASIGVPGSGPRVDGTHRLALTAGHEIDLWGRLAAGTEAARQRLAAQGWARQTVAWSLSAQVAEAHFGERALLRQREIVAAVRASRQRQVALQWAAAQAGAGSELDLRRAEAELAAADASEADLSRRTLALQNALALLTGLPLSEFGRIGLDGGVPLDPAHDLDVALPAGELSTLLLRRPDLHRAEADLAATQADLAQARASALPALRLSGSVGSDVRDLSALLSGPGFAWSVAASLVQPIFDGGRVRARVREQAAHEAEALAQYRKAVAAAVLDVREAYLSLQANADALAAGRRRVDALASAVRLARLGQQAGLLAPLDTLDAERQHLQAQLAEVEAVRERLLLQVQAFKALGGGPAAIPLAQAGD